MTALAVALLSLTIPQRKALGAHLVAWAFADWSHNSGSPAVYAEVQALASRLLSPAVNQVTPTDMAILQAAVYLSPARDLIPTTTLRTLERAWTKLGWAWQWPGETPDVSAYDAALVVSDDAAYRIRALLAPTPEPPTTQPGDQDVVKLADDRVDATPVAFNVYTLVPTRPVNTDPLDQAEREALGVVLSGPGSDPGPSHFQADVAARPPPQEVRATTADWVTWECTVHGFAPGNCSCPPVYRIQSKPPVLPVPPTGGPVFPRAPAPEPSVYLCPKHGWPHGMGPCLTCKGQAIGFRGDVDLVVDNLDRQPWAPDEVFHVPLHTPDYSVKEHGGDIIPTPENPGPTFQQVKDAILARLNGACDTLEPLVKDLVDLYGDGHSPLWAVNIKGPEIPDPASRFLNVQVTRLDPRLPSTAPNTPGEAPDLDFGPADPAYRPTVPTIQDKPPAPFTLDPAKLAEYRHWESVLDARSRLDQDPTAGRDANGKALGPVVCGPHCTGQNIDRPRTDRCSAVGCQCGRTFATPGNTLKKPD